MNPYTLHTIMHITTTHEHMVSQADGVDKWGL